MGKVIFHSGPKPTCNELVPTILSFNHTKCNYVVLNKDVVFIIVACAGINTIVKIINSLMEYSPQVLSQTMDSEWGLALADKNENRPNK